MINETGEALGMVATGRTERGDMIGDLSTAAANIALVRAVASIYSESTAMAADVMSAGVPANLRPFAASMSEAVAKIPGGARSSMEAFSNFVMDNEVTKEAGKALDSAKKGAEDAYNRTKLDAEDAYDDAEGKASDAYGSVKKGAKAAKKGVKDAYNRTKLDAEDAYDDAEGKASDAYTSLREASEWTGKEIMENVDRIGDVVNSAAVGILAAPGLAMQSIEGQMGGMGDISFESGEAAIKAAQEAAVGVAKGLFAELKVYKNDVLKKAGSMSSMGAGEGAMSTAEGSNVRVKSFEGGIGAEADAAFKAAQTALGEAVRGIPERFAGMAETFDEAKASAVSYIEGLPEAARSELESAWSEAKALGDTVDSEMSVLSNKMADLIKGAQEILSPKPEDPNKPKGGAVPKTSQEKIKEGMESREKSKRMSRKARRDSKQDVALPAAPVKKEEGNSLWSQLQSASPGLASAMTNAMDRVKSVRDTAMQAAQPHIDKAVKAIQQAPEDIKESYEEAKKSFNDTVASTLEEYDSELESVSSAFATAGSALSSLSEMVDEEARKNGKVWVEGYIRAAGEEVEGFWRKAASSVFGNKVKN
jgi:hypothetical protein